MRGLVLAAVLCAGCATGVQQTPTPTSPKVGCIAPSAAAQSHSAGKILPEIVRIIGEYAHDTDQWMVLRAGEFDPKKWVPMPKSAIRFIACGPEAMAYGLPDASTGGQY